MFSYPDHTTLPLTPTENKERVLVKASCMVQGGKFRLTKTKLLSPKPCDLFSRKDLIKVSPAVLG